MIVDYLSFFSKLREVDSLDENGIYSLTGCLSSCTKDELEIAEASEIAIKEKFREWHISLAPAPEYGHVLDVHNPAPAPEYGNVYHPAPELCLPEHGGCADGEAVTSGGYRLPAK